MGSSRATMDLRRPIYESNIERGLMNKSNQAHLTRSSVYLLNALKGYIKKPKSIIIDDALYRYAEQMGYSDIADKAFEDSIKDIKKSE